jgi:CRAL/TRIO domain
MEMTMWDINVACSAVSSWIRGWSSSPYHVCGYLLIIYVWRCQGLSYMTAGPDEDSTSDGKRRRTYQIDHDSNRSTTEDFDEPFLRQKEDEMLKESIPSSTDAERRRFLLAESGNVTKASARLSKYVSWTTTHQNIQRQIQAYEQWTSREKKNHTHAPSLHETEETLDDDDWQLACAAAIFSRNEPVSPTRTRLPRIARTFYDDQSGEVCRCHNGHRIIHVAPGKMDDRLVPLETYALAIALYMDRKLSRDSCELFTVMIDARGGVGWRNPHAAHLIPFIQHTSELLLSMFPERLGRAIVYPVPWCLSWIWSVVRCCLDPKTSGKIHLLNGPAKVVSPPPHDQIVRYLTDELSNRIEAERIASFLDPLQGGNAPNPQ